MIARASVVIPCYNAAPWIRETLASALVQESVCAEIIAVDGGSRDGTCEIIRDEFPTVRLVVATERGIGLARNLGTRVATGEFLQYLDADDVLTEGKISWQLTWLVKTGADVAYGDWQNLVLHDEDYVEGAVIAPKMSDPEIDSLDSISGFWCPTAAYLFRREIVERIGGWSESLVYFEDDRFVQDCAFAGARFAYVPGLTAYYRVHPGLLTRPRPSGREQDRYRNIDQARTQWMLRGGLTEAQRKCLAGCLADLERSCRHKDRRLFETVLRDLDTILPGYIPESPKTMRIASRLIGYPTAARIARPYRQARRFVRSLLAGTML